MGRCEWCNGEFNSLIEYIDAIGENHSICEKCNHDYVEGCECRKCGDTVDPMIMINGLCSKCVQADIMKRSKKREEAMMSMGIDTLTKIGRKAAGIEFTNDDYEQWLVFGSTYKEGDIMRSVELKRIWIMVKLNATGVYEPSLIADNYKDIEALLDRNFTKLVGNKCKIILANTPESRKLVREGEVIDYENITYILKDTFTEP